MAKPGPKPGSGFKPPNPHPKGQPIIRPPDPLVDLWLAERCAVHPNLKCHNTTLSLSWLDWCKAHGFNPGHPREFVYQLTLRGFSYVNQHRNAPIGIAVSDRA